MYELRLPAPDLAPYIENYWEVSSAPESPVDLRVDVFVDARADLIFNYGAPYRRTVIGGASRSLSASNLDAQRLEPIRIEQSGSVHTVGVRFRLGGVGAFASTSLRAITGQTAAPEAVFGETALTLERSLAGLGSLDAKAEALDAFFRARLNGSAAFERFRTALALCAPAQKPDAEQRHADAADDDPVEDTPTVAAVAAATGVSTRQVERLFARFLGIPPKALLRVTRFQVALRMLMRDPGCTLADVAAEAGYFDQAHFVKDFRAMTGGVPRGYRGYYPEQGPHDFAPNVVVFLQEDEDATT